MPSHPASPETRTVTLLRGDGIGPEVVDAALRVVEAAGVVINWEEYAVGLPALAEGAATPLPEEVIASIGRNGVALKGPVSTLAGRTGFRSVNIELRRRLDLYAQARPCRSYPGVPSPFGDVDVVVIRETTEDLYAGVELERRSDEARKVIEMLARAGHSVDGDAGLSIKPTSEAAARRAIEFAFRYARDEGRARVTAVHKASVMRCTDGLFLEVAREVASANPDLGFDDCAIDNLCAQIVRRPAAFDVLVMPNMYGDIVSDLAASLAGGVGLAPGMNVGDSAAVFEPAHGSAPKHAGRNAVNPLATILSCVLLLGRLGEKAAADRITRAVAAVLLEGDSVTYDLKRWPGDPAAVTTSQAADAVIARLS